MEVDAQISTEEGVDLRKKKEKKVFIDGDASLESPAKLLRFLYIGNDENVVISKRCSPITIENLDVRLKFINDMAGLRYSLPFGIIKKVMLTGTLIRNDEALLAISYCLRKVNNIGTLDKKLKTEIYQSLPELLRTDSDLFLFVSLSNRILNEGTTEKTGFGRGMKKALRQWYELRTAEELANLFGRNRGMYGWTHRDIVHMCHMNFGALEKAKIISTLFKRGSATLNEMKELPLLVPDETWSKAIERIFKIFSLKVNESADDAAAMIELHNFDVGHLPAHLYSHHQVWNILIPKMNYRELLKVFKTLHSMNMLKATDPSLKEMSMSLGNGNLIKASEVHPMEIYSVLKLYEKNQRYNECIKNDWYQKKKVQKLNLVPDPTIVEQLTIGVDIALNNCPPAGCDFVITLNLRESDKKHTVLRMKQMTCLEAMVLYALTYRKREKNAKIYSFSDDPNKLLPIKLTTDMSYEKALSHCETLTLKNTKPNLSLPFQYATGKNTIFLTIVDSVARFCKNGQAPIEQFRSYRQNNTHSKFIVVNLRRGHGDLKFSYEKGFLEICGLTPDTHKIINAFATNAFA